MACHCAALVRYTSKYGSSRASNSFSLHIEQIGWRNSRRTRPQSPRAALGIDRILHCGLLPILRCSTDSQHDVRPGNVVVEIPIIERGVGSLFLSPFSGYFNFRIFLYSLWAGQSQDFSTRPVPSVPSPYDKKGML